MPYVAQRFGTWEVLDRDLPLTVTDGPEWGLNMYGILEATIAPEPAHRIAADGHPVVAKWGTIINFEPGESVGRRRWQGIVDEVKPDGKNLKIRVRELHGYPDGLTYTGRIHGVKVDPAKVFAQLWDEIQAIKGGNFGVTVSGSTPLRVGTDSDLKADAAMRDRDTKKAELEAKSKPRKSLEAQIKKIRASFAQRIEAATRSRDFWAKEYTARTKSGASASSIAAAKASAEEARAQLTTWRNQMNAQIEPLQTRLDAAKDAEEPYKARYDKAVDVYNAAKQKAQDDGGGLKIYGADYPDVWKEMLKLATEHGFEFSTRTMWTDDTAPDFRVVISYPSTGRSRRDLVFQQGVNIVSELKPRPTVYASEVLGRGAGEGDESVRASAARVDWRARRNTVLARPDVTKSASLRAEVRRELGWSVGAYEIPEIEVREHDLARFYSWDVGDSILVQGEIPHIGDYSAWHRVMSWKLLANGNAQLRLEKVVTT